MERGYLNDVIEEVLENESLLTTKIDFDSLKSGRDAINSLRNRVSHNKIMLNFNSNSLDLKQALIWEIHYQKIIKMVLLMILTIVLKD